MSVPVLPVEQAVRYTVSQVRTAVVCPRVFYFDAEKARRTGRAVETTRLWKVAGREESTACGSLFHQTIERFNSAAAADGAVQTAIASASDITELAALLHQRVYFHYLNIDSLAKKTAEQQLNLIQVLRHYLFELASLLWHGRMERRDVADILQDAFGERRRKVDVTFHVGPQQSPVRVVGVLDYLFYDARSGNHRILDFKLTPASELQDDLTQVCVYALMHNQQHHTEAAVGVLYLFPERRLEERSWEDVLQHSSRIFSLLASMKQWELYDAEAQTGLQPPGNPEVCDVCRWRRECVDRLGPVKAGAYERHETPSIIKTAGSDESLPGTDPVDSTHTDTAVQDQTTEASVLQPGNTIDGHQPITIHRQHLSTHTAIVGAAGSGKTFLAKVFVEEAILNGVPVLAVDPQGDLVQFLHSQPEDRIPHEQRSRFHRFRDLVEPRIYTPGTSHGIRLSLSPIRLPRPEDLSHLPPARQAEEFEAIVNAVAMHLIGLTLKGRRSVEQQQTFMSQILKALVRSVQDRPLQLTDIAAAVHAPDGIGLDDVDMLIKKSERENLGRQLYALSHGPLARLFSGGTALDLNAMKTPVQPGRIPLNIIYLNALTEQEKHAFLAALATEMYRWMSCSGGDPLNPQLLFYLDEARDYLPAGATMPAAKQPVSRLFTQARKYGVGCLVCTQSPRSVDYNVFGNCSTKIIGRLETPQDTEQVGKWFSNSGTRPSWVADRVGAEQGTFVARWPGQPDELEGAVFKSRHLFSAHGGAWSSEQVEREVAVDAVHEQLRNV